MNTQIRRLGIGLLACYLALFVMLNWIQVVHKDALDNNALNDLRVKQLFNKDRGTITSADGALLAKSVDGHRLVGLQPPARATRRASCSPSSPATTRSTTAPPGWS